MNIVNLTLVAKCATKKETERSAKEIYQFSIPLWISQLKKYLITD